ncbi:hypothetical protein, partial [Paracoccus sp. (in: a-proteobacteria)]|uniref:hypothetical protein n=1 Tax=Paracoccus sp. TaxID=267 RepID=UPI00396CFF02
QDGEAGSVPNVEAGAFQQPVRIFLFSGPAKADFSSVAIDMVSLLLRKGSNRSVGNHSSAFDIQWPEDHSIGAQADLIKCRYDHASRALEELGTRLDGAEEQICEPDRPAGCLRSRADLGASHIVPRGKEICILGAKS